MNIDIRLKLDVFEHPKIRKLRRRLGPEAVLGLLRLWLWAAGNRADGVLCGLDADDLELAAGWDGPEGALAEALCELRLLELCAMPNEAPLLKEREQDETKPQTRAGAGQGAVYVIHDWAEHQTWASRSDERSRNARRAAQSRWDVREPEAPQKPARKAVRISAKNPPEPAQTPAPSLGPAARPSPLPSPPASPSMPSSEAEKHGKAEEITQENKVLCENMRPASPRNAPRTKNQEPICKPESSASPEVRARAGAVPTGGPEGAGRDGLTVKGPAEQGQAVPDTAGQSRGDTRGASPCRTMPEQPPHVLASRADIPQPAAELVPAGQAVPSAAIPAVAQRRNAMPPSLQDVEMYCALRGNGISARRFVAYYEARGWRVGDQPMRDWQATIRLWERRDREQAGQGAGQRREALGTASARAAPAVPELLPPRTALCGTAPCGTAPYPAAFPLSARGVRGGQGEDSTGLTFGYASLRASTVHQAVVRERDMMARMLLSDIRGLHAQPSGHAASCGTAQSSLPPEWAICR